MLIQKYTKVFIQIIILLSCGLSTVFLQNSYIDKIISSKNTISAKREEQALKTIVELQKKMPTFGFDNLIAGWNYLQFVQYFGDAEAREETGYSLVTDYFEVLVEKDPRFVQAYLSLSSANSIFAAKPQKTVSLINEVLESVSPDMPGYPFLLWTYKATDEILFLGDLQAAQNSYLTAAEWASKREDELGEKMANRYLQTVQFLASNPDSTEKQIAAWILVLNNAKDEKTKSYALEKLKDLGAEISITKEGQLKITMPTQV